MNQRVDVLLGNYASWYKFHFHRGLVQVKWTAGADLCDIGSRVVAIHFSTIFMMKI
jgi:hypothetical protein